RLLSIAFFASKSKEHQTSRQQAKPITPTVGLHQEQWGTRVFDFACSFSISFSF
ncbi:Hypothetical predicted protein, partial [Paramuricea clavata]